MDKLSEVKVAGGTLIRARHESSSTKLPMTFAVFLPKSIGPVPEEGWPVLYWLSGLTCDDTNFSTKAGAFASASREGVAIVLPDTSPRGAGVPGEDEAYDLGTGAGAVFVLPACGSAHGIFATGFYVDATAAPWSTNYHMYTYVTVELPALVEKEFGFSPKLKAIFGHSMGGATSNSPIHDNNSARIRPRRAHDRAQEFRCLHLGVSFCPHLSPNKLSLGTKGIQALLGFS